MTTLSTRPPRPAPELAPAAERGSAYLFVLLALLVMTVIGLSLVVVTQTETRIGASEKTVTRVLYGADAGARLQLARKLVANEGLKIRFKLLDDVNRAGGAFAETVDVSEILVAYKGDCNLCTVNEDNENKKAAINYVTNAQGRRRALGAVPSDDIPQANKLISFMYFVQPRDPPTADLGQRTFDPALTADDPDSDGLDIIVY